MTPRLARALFVTCGVAAVVSALAGRIVLAFTLCLAALLWLAESQRERP